MSFALPSWTKGIQNRSICSIHQAPIEALMQKQKWKQTGCNIPLHKQVTTVYSFQPEAVGHIEGMDGQNWATNLDRKALKDWQHTLTFFIAFFIAALALLSNCRTSLGERNPATSIRKSSTLQLGRKAAVAVSMFTVKPIWQGLTDWWYPRQAYTENHKQVQLDFFMTES